ncbi:MAG: transposase [Cyanobacteria bacterium P01_C01_bin.118]
MPNYRRPYIAGGTYFITQVTYQRVPWLCWDIGRQALREAFITVKERHPFSIEAIVLLPEHFHCLLTLPENDADFSVRLRLIKTHVTKRYGAELKIGRTISQSRQKRREGNLWQRRYWEHFIRDEKDFAIHCDYIHYNPVRHGLCEKPRDWKYSSVHRFIAEGIYPPNWCEEEGPEIPHDVWDTP